METHLNVENVHLHEESLWMLGFGPDILYLIEDGVLKDMGLMPKNVIWLKQNLQQWWNSADAKRKRANHTPSPVQSIPPNKRVAFKKRFHASGGYKVYGPKMVESDLLPDLDYDWYYFCKACNAIVPLSFGYMPVVNGK